MTQVIERPGETAPAQLPEPEVAPQTGEVIAALVAASLATPADIVRKAERAATPE